VNRGVIHLLRENYDQALQDFEVASRLNPREPESFLNKGILKLRTDGKPGEVIQLADAALANGTRKPALAFYTRAVAHEETGNLAAAYRDYRQAAQLAPEWELPSQDLKRFVVKR
jgi:tetratricopeptide (TPR) repeat protein